MRILNRQIDVVATMGKDEVIPDRFRIENKEGELTVVKIDQIIHAQKTKDPFNPKINLLIFQCRSTIEDNIRDYELKFESENLKWYLYRM